MCRWGNELIAGFAQAAIEGEKLSQREVTDLLTVSFSSNYDVGHAVGPDAPEVRDMALRVDELLGKLLESLDPSVGMKNVVVILTADHGVAPEPKWSAARKIPGEWLIPGSGDTVLYLDHNAVVKAKCSSDEIDQAVVEGLLAIPQLHIARVYSRRQLMKGVAGDFIATAALNGFNARRGGYFLIFEPNFIPGTGGTSHFSPYGYDHHVPLLFAGPGIKPGTYPAHVLIRHCAYSRQHAGQ